MTGGPAGAADVERAVERVVVRSGAYHDSVTLMQVGRAASGLPGVLSAQVGMGTELNLELLSAAGFGLPEGIGPNDLVIAVRAEDEAALGAGLAAVDAALASGGRGPGGSSSGSDRAPGRYPARTTASAAARARADGEPAGLALVSVPGEHAFTEAMDALDAGLPVMLFSDNVPVEQEVRLKDEGAARGLLVMGPDCGTAVVGGVGLGFADVLRPGPVALVAASGTGAQQLSCLLDEAGVGVRHVLGVGGRDLSAEVGGRGARQALELLAADPAVELVVVVSKPPDPVVAESLQEFASGLRIPVLFALLGPGQPDLTAMAAQVCERLGRPAPEPAWWPAPEQRQGSSAVLRGAFSGGTLCDEAMVIAAAALGPVASNIPLPGAPRVTAAEVLRADGAGPAGHVMVDFGDDELTRGRPHPMIDSSLRADWLRAQAAAGPAVLLLDVVLGHGADPDPAALLAPAIADCHVAARAAGHEVAVVVSLCGTDGDPQGLAAQAARLSAAGASVHRSNAAAARQALELLAADAPGRALGAEAPTAQQARPGAPRVQAMGAGAPTTQQAPPGAPRAQQERAGTSPPEGDAAASAGTVSLLGGELRVVTAGASLFAEALAAQAVPVSEVDWRPPAEAGAPSSAGTVAELLARVAADPRRAAANATAAERMLASRARLVDVRPASEALGLEPGTFLHAGPPLGTPDGSAWERASGPMRGALQGAMVLEGLAADPEDAERRLRDAGPPGSGAPITLDPCHHHAAVGPMAGVVSPSMWMFELEDASTGRRAWCSLNEGLGKVLRYGAFGPEVVDRLRWMSGVLGPLLQVAVRSVRDATGPVDITAILAQMLQMGDEGHNRNRAGTLMLLRELLPAMIASGADPADVARAVAFVAGNDHFFLNLGMPACKLACDAARDLPGSTVVVAMARNGTDFGIQVSGTGDRWFTGPANTPEGLYLGDYGPDDANPDIGDSAITETAGIGGFAMAAAPAIVRLVGGDVPFALTTTARMHEICVAENAGFGIPVLDFRGTATGIDVTRVVRTGILPQINTGMAGRVAGTGQVGAGLVTPPAEVFPAALAALAAQAAQAARAAATSSPS